MQDELLVVYATQLLEKEHSGCLALLQDEKVFSCLVVEYFCSRLFQTYPDILFMFFVGG